MADNAKDPVVNCFEPNTSDSATMMMLSSRTRFVEAISNAIAAVKWAPLRKIRAGKCHGRVGAGRRGCPERERRRDRTRAIIRQKLTHLLLRNGGLHDGGECEAED